MKTEAILYFTIEFDDAVTDHEALAAAMDKLIETITSTPGIWDDYASPEHGSPAVGEVYCIGQHKTEFVTIANCGNDEQVEIRRVLPGGYLIGIDGSYLEQDVGPVYDPINWGFELQIPADKAEGVDEI